MRNGGGKERRREEGWWRKRKRERERGAERSSTRVGEGSNVIQIAGNLSQKQLSVVRAREIVGSSITSPCIGIGDRTFLNNRARRARPVGKKVSDEPFAERKEFSRWNITPAWPATPRCAALRLLDRISASSIEAARWPTVVTNNIVPIINATAAPPLPPSHADPDDPLVYTPVSRNFRFGMNGVDAIGIEGRLFNSGIITKERTVE